MKTETKDLFSTIKAEGIEEFLQILDVPDEQFDAIYPQLKKELLDQLRDNTAFQKHLMTELEKNPVQDIESEREAIDEFLGVFDADDTISDNKKEMLHLLFDSVYDTTKNLVETNRESIPVEVVKLDKDVKLPTYAHSTDAGADVYANEEVTIEAGATAIVPTGIKVAIPAGYEIQIRPRSGLSLKTGLRIANSVGTIDSEYRGEVGIIITNTSSESFTINKYDRIAQMCIAPTPMIKWKEVSELSSSNRGEGGYGSSGK